MYLTSGPGLQVQAAIIFLSKARTTSFERIKCCKRISLNNGDIIMKKTILVTGSIDGIGLETAEMLVSLEHNV